MDKTLRTLILVGLFVIPSIITIYIYNWEDIHSLLQLLLFALIVGIIFLPGIMIIITLWKNKNLQELNDTFNNGKRF